LPSRPGLPTVPTMGKFHFVWNISSQPITLIAELYYITNIIAS
jgi:hypothetical protein